jgi:hypothetical protein
MLLHAAAASQCGSQLSDVVSSITGAVQGQVTKHPPHLPQQRQLQFPDAELVEQLCCPPELVLLEHFRVQRKQILEVCLVTDCCCSVHMKTLVVVLWGICLNSFMNHLESVCRRCGSLVGNVVST